MKSSTLYRSNLSKERMAVLEGQKARIQTPAAEKNLGEYVRPARDKELDVLWQNFKTSNLRREKTPAVYLAIGFIVGILCTLALVGIFALASKPSVDAPKRVKTDKNLTIIPADQIQEPTYRSEEYTIKSGDTLDKVVVRFYGKYDPAKIEQIQQVNNLESPHKLRIGQVLTIPIEE